MSSNALASSSKHRSKKDKSKSKHRDKHAAIDKGKAKSSPFQHQQSRMRLSIAPKYSGDLMEGAKETLDGMVMRYVPQMSGVLLAHWNHEFSDDTAGIIDDCPFAVCSLGFESIIWAPKIGQKMYGTHLLSSPSHLSLLFSKTFNISIPLQHIPLDLYEFDSSLGEEDGDDSDSDDEDSEGHGHSVGRWRDKSSGKLLGEGGKGVKFTVIGMEVTNQMLSLTGSLLADPSNPPPEKAAQLGPTTISFDSPSPSPSPSPEPERVLKAAKTAHKSIPNHAAVPEAEVVDERFLNPRELKQRRKEEERAKKA
ncbi:DNA-directed RNA polymerase I subunit RPA43, partial [Tremellales sp. Uapishka_1]